MSGPYERTQRIRIFVNTAGERNFVAGEPKSTDSIVYGDLVYSVRVKWKMGGQALFLHRLAQYEAMNFNPHTGEWR